MKKWIVALLITVITFSTNISVFANDIKVLVNNQQVQSNLSPQIINNVTYVPLRPVAEAMGCEVVWVAGNNTANIKNLTTIIAMQIDNKKVTKVKRTDKQNQSIIECENPPKMINGNVYIPLRTMAESMGATVAWDNNTKTAVIVYDTTIKYAGNKAIVKFAGNGGRKRYDSTIDKMEFLSPESIAVDNQGTLILSDSGAVRKISSATSSTIEFEPEYISSAKIRTFGNHIYFTTNAFEDENGMQYYGIVKLSNGVAEGVYITEAVYSKITDFDIDNQGNIYALLYNAGVSKNYIAQFTGNDMTFLQEVDEGFQCMSADDSGNLYLGNTIKGSIYYYDVKQKTMKLVAGVDDNTRFVDGEDPMFFEPRSLYYSDNSLYVLDYNLIRRLQLNGGGVALYSETLAGKITSEIHPQTKAGPAKEAEIAANYLAEIAVSNGKVYLTDPVNDVLWYVE